MKHLFNNISQEEKKQILEMHTPNLVNESESQIQKLAVQGQEYYNSLSEPEKMKFRKAFKLCWKEYGINASYATFMFVFALVGLYFIFKKGEINVVSAGMTGIAGVLGFQTVGKVKEFIQCIRKKMNEPELPQTPQTDNSAPIGDPDVENK
jgi:hypothetical protein